MNISTALTATKAFTVKNAPTIMTTLGVGGLISAGVIAFRKKEDLNDAFYALKREIIKEQQLNITPHDMKLKPVDAFGPFIKTMWAPLALGIGGSVLIFTANGINIKRNAALALGYGLLERTVDGLEEEIRTNLGEEKAEEIHANVAQKQYEARKSIEEENIEILDPNGYLIYDTMFDKEFISTSEKVEAAVNAVNSEVLALNDQTVNDFRSLLGMKCEKSKALDYFGWKYPQQLKVHFYRTEKDEKGRPALLMEYKFDVLHFDEPF